MGDFWLGVCTSLLATIIWVFVHYVRRTLAIRDLRGVWVEIRHASSPNPHNVCFLEIRYSLFEKGYEIEGVVYNNSWRYEARWKTMNCSVEKNLGRIFYSYSGHHADLPYSTSHGYGLMILREQGKRLLMKDGYFLDAQHFTTPVTSDYFHITSLPNVPHVASIADIDSALESANSPLRASIAELLARRDMPPNPKGSS